MKIGRSESPVSVLNESASIVKTSICVKEAASSFLQSVDKGNLKGSLPSLRLEMASAAESKDLTSLMPLIIDY